MPSICQVGLCKHNSDNNPELTFLSFPADEKIRKQWIKVVEMTRQNYIYKRHHRICSVHFDDEDNENVLRADIMQNMKMKNVRAKLRPGAIPKVRLMKENSPTVKKAIDKRGGVIRKREVFSMIQSESGHSGASCKRSKSGCGIESQENHNTGEDLDNDPDFIADFDGEEEIFKNYERPDTTILGEVKYLVGESQLMSLFDYCRQCGGLTERTIIRRCGTAVEVEAQCMSRECRNLYKWASQPKFRNTYAFNILLSAVILVSGCCISQFLRALRLLNVAVFTDRTYFYNQKWYLFPAVSFVYAAQNKELIHPREVDISVDMRCDSPGHTAKFGTYTTIDAKNNKVIHVEVVQKNECSSSNGMELEGYKRTQINLESNGLKIKRIVSDRHVGVAAHLRKQTDILHYFDAWHIAKGLKKKLSAASSRKSTAVIGKWIRPIMTMVYWLATTSPETTNILHDQALRRAKFNSIYNHVRGIHEHEDENWPKCAHGLLEPREYIQPSSKADEAVSKILQSPHLIRDIAQISPTIQTYSNETFHGVINHFAPKMHSYSYKGMLARTYLSAMHYNENAGRLPKTNKDGEVEYSVWFSRAKNDWAAKKHLVDPTFEYATNTLEMVAYMATAGNKEDFYVAEMLCDPGSIASKLQKPNKKDFVASMISRFKVDDD